MHVAVLQPNLQKALRVVSKAINAKSALPVLANVLFQVNHNSLNLVATDIQTMISIRLGANGDDAFEFTLPAQMLSQLVNAFPDERVDLTWDPVKKQAEIVCGSHRTVVHGISATEFPIPPVMSGQRFSVSARLFAEGVRHTAFAVDQKGIFGILGGMQLAFDDTRLHMVASDSYRLALQTLELAQDVNGFDNVVVPLDAITSLATIVTKDSEELIVEIDQNRIRFLVDTVEVTSLLLDGTYPNVMAIIPKTSDQKFSIDNNQFMEACQQAMVFARDWDDCIRFEIEPDTLTIVGKSRERGSSRTTLQTEGQSKSTVIGFDVRYLEDVSKAIGKKERLVFETHGAKHAGVFRPEHDDGRTYVVMPRELLA